MVEVIVAVSVAIFSILAVWKVYIFFIKISLSNPATFQASFLAEEGVEAVKFMRDYGWNTNIAPLSSSTSYTLVFGTTWGLTATPSFIDGRFDRRIIFSDVYRDGLGNIAEIGSPDAGTKKVLVTVSWPNETGTSTKEITTYVSNIFKN